MKSNFCPYYNVLFVDFQLDAPDSFDDKHKIDSLINALNLIGTVEQFTRSDILVWSTLYESSAVSISLYLYLFLQLLKN